MSPELRHFNPINGDSKIGNTTVVVDLIQLAIGLCYPFPPTRCGFQCTIILPINFIGLHCYIHFMDNYYFCTPTERTNRDRGKFW